MSDGYILAKDHLLAFLRRISKGSRLVAPVTNEHGDTLLQEVDCLDEAAIDLTSQPQNSAKSFFFPQHEPLYRYEAADSRTYSFTPLPSSEPTVFFGLRSCDLAAILYMDVVFSRPQRDPSYFDKREKSLLISLGCNEPFENCFCHATKSGPFLDFGYDLRFSDLGDRYLVEPGRGRGDAIIERWRHFFSKSSHDDDKAHYQLQLESRNAFRRSVHIDLAITKIGAMDVEQSVWEELAQRCQDCGGCAYICPTCTCFSLVDYPLSDTAGERIRTWDACTFAGFTKMAGGHNPVSPRHTLRRRFLHKLRYDVERHGRPSCVGCGRCVGICFGGVDIIRFINMVGDA